jgi:signal transduction histidine kinase
LTTILGNASLASIEIGAASPLQKHFQRINDGALRAADLCKQLLAYSGEGQFVVQNFCLNEALTETTHLLLISISKKAVLCFNLHEDLPSIEADPTQIRQILINLVINASAAIGDKSGIISLNTGLTRVDRTYLGGTMLADDLPEGTYVYIEVSDNACGMTKETLDKVFDPFFTTKFEGRGLDLSASIGIMRGHKGTLKVYSEVNRGTTFKLLFSCAQGEAQALPKSNKATDLRFGTGPC